MEEASIVGSWEWSEIEKEIWRKRPVKFGVALKRGPAPRGLKGFVRVDFLDVQVCCTSLVYKLCI